MSTQNKKPTDTAPGGLLKQQRASWEFSRYMVSSREMQLSKEKCSDSGLSSPLQIRVY